MKLEKALGIWPGALLPIKQNHPMKEFMLFFIFEDLAALEKANQAEMNGGNGCFSWIEKLEGKYVGGNALRPEGKRVSGKGPRGYRSCRQRDQGNDRRLFSGEGQGPGRGDPIGARRLLGIR
jgi:hypothetical protein